MQRVIDGLTYNTDTAEKIGDWDNGLGYGDFSHLFEQLYRTKKGRFFIAGQGGPMTKYRQSCGSMIGGSSEIAPQTPAAALTWCEEHDVDANTITMHFKVEAA